MTPGWTDVRFHHHHFSKFEIQTSKRQSGTTLACGLAAGFLLLLLLLLLLLFGRNDGGVKDEGSKDVHIRYHVTCR